MYYILRTLYYVPLLCDVEFITMSFEAGGNSFQDCREVRRTNTCIQGQIGSVKRAGRGSIESIVTGAALIWQ